MCVWVCGCLCVCVKDSLGNDRQPIVGFAVCERVRVLARARARSCASACLSVCACGSVSLCVCASVSVFVSVRCSSCVVCCSLGLRVVSGVRLRCFRISWQHARVCPTLELFSLRDIDGPQQHSLQGKRGLLKVRHDSFPGSTIRRLSCVFYPAASLCKLVYAKASLAPTIRRSLWMR